MRDSSRLRPGVPIWKGTCKPTEIADNSTQEELGVHNLELMKAGWLDVDHGGA